MTNETAIADSERELLRESVHGFLADQWPVEGAVERSGDPGALARIWKQIAAQGLTRLGFDREEGGLREILVVSEAFGRASCPSPLMGAVILNLARSRAPGASPGLESLCRDLHNGSAIAAIAFGAFDGDRAAGSVSLSGGAMTGRMGFVENAETATHFVLFATTPPGLAFVPAGANGLRVSATPGLAVPALSELTFDGIAAPLVELPADRLAELAEVGRFCAAARALGAAQRGFELALAHAKMRRQFGQFIGQFQAIQHKLADCLTRLDGARLTLDAAAEIYDRGLGEWRIFAAAAFAYAAPALRQVVLEAHHTMGAIGYAEEHEMPRHFRRIHADLARFGGAPRARADLADYLLGPNTANRKAS